MLHSNSLEKATSFPSVIKIIQVNQTQALCWLNGGNLTQHINHQFTTTYFLLWARCTVSLNMLYSWVEMCYSLQLPLNLDSLVQNWSKSGVLLSSLPSVCVCVCECVCVCVCVNPQTVRAITIHTLWVIDLPEFQAPSTCCLKWCFKGILLVK